MGLALLCQKRFPINFQTSLMQAGQAFPIVVYTHKLEDNSRKIMDISDIVVIYAFHGKTGIVVAEHINLEFSDKSFLI